MDIRKLRSRERESPNDCQLSKLWTYLGHNGLVTDLIGPVTAGLKEAPTTPLHHPAGEPAEEEKLAGPGEAPVLVTYKEFVARRSRSSPLVRCRPGEEEALLGVPGGDGVVVVLAYEGCRLWQVLN